MLDQVLERGGSGSANRVVVSSPGQFEQAVEVASLAGRNGNPALALQAVRTSLSGRPD
jgi:hypothetical protein